RRDGEENTLPSDECANRRDQLHIPKPHCLAWELSVSHFSMQLDNLCQRDRFTRRYDPIYVEVQVEVLELLPVKIDLVGAYQYSVRLPEKVFAPGKGLVLNQNLRIAVGSHFEAERGGTAEEYFITPKHELSKFGHEIKNESPAKSA